MSIFVSLSGNDTTGTGTILNPYLTWTKGLQSASLGETVYVRGGTYTTTVSNPTGITFGTQESERITLMNYDGESVSLQPSAGSVCFQLKADNASSATISYFTLSGLTFDGSNLAAASQAIVKIWNQAASDINNVIVDGCTLNNAPDHALQIIGTAGGGGATTCTIQNCTILNPANNPGSEVNNNGMYLIGPNFVVQDNVVGYTITPQSGSNCIRLGASTDTETACTNGIIRRNYVYGAKYGIILGKGNDMQCVNNLIRLGTATGTLGIQVWSSATLSTDNMKIYHNTLVHASGMTHGIRGIGSGITNTLVRNNIIRRATTAIDLSGDTGTPVTTNNYTGTAPGFANDGGTAIADYILTGTPATQDAGADLRSDVPTDFYGNTRDATPDQGFYELVVAAAPTVTVSAAYTAAVNVAYPLNDGVVADVNNNTTYLDGVFDNVTTTVALAGSPGGTLTTRS